MIRKFKAGNIQPGAWWLLGLSFAVLAGSSRSIGLLLSVIAASVLIIVLAREKAPWSQSLRFYLVLGLAVVLIRIAFRMLFNYGAEDPAPLISLPLIELDFGLLGKVTLLGGIGPKALHAALIDGLRMAAIIISIGMANSLANPRRLLKSTPGALYEIAAAVTVALNLAPQLILSAQRVRKARRLRGRSRGLRALNSFIIPTLEDAIDQSLSLAASMEARGFGRQGSLTSAQARMSRATSLLSVLAASTGSYLLLATPQVTAALSLLALAVFAMLTTLKITSKRNLRSKYSPTVWQPQDFVILGLCLLVIISAASRWWQ
jgi:energy-coupling factor transport system permease protein